MGTEMIPAAHRDTATPVWWLHKPWHGSGSSCRGTLSGGRDTGSKAVLAASSCQGHSIRLERKEKTEEFNCQIYCSSNCNRNDCGSCQVTKLLLSSSRVLQLMPIVIAEHPCSCSGSLCFEVDESGSALSSSLCFLIPFYFSSLFFPPKPQVCDWGWKQNLQKWWGSWADTPPPPNLCCTSTQGGDE